MCGGLAYASPGRGQGGASPSKDKEKSTQFWLAWGERYRKDFETEREGLRRYRKQEAKLRRVLSKLPFRSFVEIGCGFGRITRYLLQPGVTGCISDISPDQLRAARTYLGTSIPMVRGDGEFLPFRERSADLVLASEVLMDLPPDEMRRALAEMARVARRYIVNLDWYARHPTRTVRGLDWSHDYPSAYMALGRDEVVELHNSVDVRRFSQGDRARVRSELGLSDEFVVTFVGHLLEFKDPATFVRAASKIPQEEAVAFLVVGSPGRGRE